MDSTILSVKTLSLYGLNSDVFASGTTSNSEILGMKNYRLSGMEGAVFASANLCAMLGHSSTLQLTKHYEVRP